MGLVPRRFLKVESMRRSSAVKRAKLQIALPYTCHWGHVPTPHQESGRTAVWICEYPYRTMRTEGPNEECAGCPIWEARCKAKRAQEALAPELVH